MVNKKGYGDFNSSLFMQKNNVFFKVIFQEKGSTLYLNDTKETGS